MPINLNILKPLPTQNDAVYKDFDLSVNIGYANSGELYKKTSVADINTDKDIDAIENSIVNLFSTTPGQKILNPRFGINLGDLLFLPATRERGQVIAQNMLKGIQRYEPRISIISFDIVADADLQQYEVDITYNIPNLNKAFRNLKGRLSKTGFIV